MGKRGPRTFASKESALKAAQVYINDCEAQKNHHEMALEKR